MFEVLLVDLSCTLLLIVLFMISTFSFCHKSLFFAKIYAMLFEKDDYKAYKEVKGYLKNNKMQLVPSIQISTARVYNDLIDKWTFAVFEDHDVAIYDNSYTLRLTNFHNKLIQDLLKDAGYTQDDIYWVAEDGKMRLQQLEREIEESQKELEELKNNLNNPNK